MKYLIVSFCFMAWVPFLGHAQEPEQFRVQVLEVLDTYEEELPGLDRTQEVQEVLVEVLNGSRSGDRIELTNDFFLSNPGDTFFVSALQAQDGEYIYSIGEPDRRDILIFTVLGAIAAVILLGGIQGARSLLALAGSIGVVVFILVPALLAGFSPLLVGVGVAIIILALVMGLTHGVSKTTLAAFIGTSAAVVVAGFLAALVTETAGLSGFVSDEVVFLNLLTDGTLNLSGIFLTAVIIGMLGVLDDVAVTQAAAVRELLGTGLSVKETLVRSMRIGREHVGALVNTLALAYAGASLPLILVFANTTQPLSLVLNREIFAAEIIRTAVGTIGIVLAVPLTTFIAVWLLTGKEKGKHPKPCGHTHV